MYRGCMSLHTNFYDDANMMIFANVATENRLDMLAHIFDLVHP